MGIGTVGGQVRVDGEWLWGLRVRFGEVLYELNKREISDRLRHDCCRDFHRDGDTLVHDLGLEFMCISGYRINGLAFNMSLGAGPGYFLWLWWAFACIKRFSHLSFSVFCDAHLYYLLEFLDEQVLVVACL